MTLFDPDPSERSRAGRGPQRRLKATVAYDGSGFHGFAANPGVKTVSGTLAAALGHALGQPVELVAAGRTDRGVHARGQVVSFDAPEDDVDLDGVVRRVNRMVGPAIAVRDLAAAEPDFDARFSARHRTYRYQVLNRVVPDPLLARFTWHVGKPLDRFAMDLACDPLIGEHDFAAFCRRPKRSDGSTASLVRRVNAARWSDGGDEGLLCFEIQAGAFCHQMVRSIVGLLVAVGLGRLRAGEVLDVVRSGDRARVPDLAPPHGLTLWSVDYDGWSS